jgi:hypothetical protein
MNTLLDKASDIIRAASATQLGLYVFCILGTAVLVVLLFQSAPLPVQIGAFIATLLLTAVILILASPRPAPIVCAPGSCVMPDGKCGVVRLTLRSLLQDESTGTGFTGFPCCSSPSRRTVCGVQGEWFTKACRCMGVRTESMTEYLHNF